MKQFFWRINFTDDGWKIFSGVAITEQLYNTSDELKSDFLKFLLTQKLDEGELIYSLENLSNFTDCEYFYFERLYIDKDKITIEDYYE